jgi:hypothetical protein
MVIRVRGARFGVLTAGQQLVSTHRRLRARQESKEYSGTTKLYVPKRMRGDTPEDPGAEDPEPLCTRRVTQPPPKRDGT